MKVLYTDIDGTLTHEGSLLHDAAGPSADAAEALVRLYEAGVTVVPVSGRSRQDLEPFARVLGTPSYICELGALIVDADGEHLTYDAPGGRTARAFLEEKGVVDAVLERAAGKLERHEPWASRREHSVLLRGELDAAAVLDLLPEGVVVIDNGPIGHPADAKLQGVDVVHAYHLTYERVNKPQGVRADLARRGLDPVEAAFVGDSSGDAAMVGVVGRVVILGVDARGATHVPARYGPGFRRAVNLLLRDTV